MCDIALFERGILKILCDIPFDIFNTCFALSIVVFLVNHSVASSICHFVLSSVDFKKQQETLYIFDSIRYFEKCTT